MLSSITPPTCLPTFLIIGAMKCGTTSLAYYLSLHPEIFISVPKEIHFFSSNSKWDRGLDWYKKHFKTRLKVRGEASPSYTRALIEPNVALRISQTIPDVKLIYVVREPIERAISNYVHCYAKNEENGSIEEAFQEIAGNHYVEKSCYAMQLNRYLKFYSISDILVLTAEELNMQRAQTLEKVFQFLGVSSNFWDDRFQKKIHQSSTKRRKTPAGVTFSQRPIPKLIEKLPDQYRYPIQDIMYWPFSKTVERPTLTPEIEAALVDYFRPDVQKLRELTGHSFSQWDRY